jgi:hypothetical protein
VFRRSTASVDVSSVNAPKDDRTTPRTYLLELLQGSLIGFNWHTNYFVLTKVWNHVAVTVGAHVLMQYCYVTTHAVRLACNPRNSCLNSLVSSSLLCASLIISRSLLSVAVCVDRRGTYTTSTRGKTASQRLPFSSPPTACKCRCVLYAVAVDLEECEAY